MIEQIASEHDKWIRFAKSICKDADMACDLVGEMYLRLIDKNILEVKGQVTSGYIYAIIKNLYFNHRKKEAKVKEGEAGYFYSNSTTVPEYDMSEPEQNKEIPDILTFSERQILLLRQDNSLREIEEQYHINRQQVWRKEKIALKKLNEWQKKSVLVMQ